MAEDNAHTPVAPAWNRRGTLYVIGIDGMTLDVITPLAERGELPNLTRIAAEGAHGRLKTASPANSSMLWTTIATGRHHKDHGIDHFRYYSLLGKKVSHFALKRGRKGAKQFLRFLKALGLMRTRFFDGSDVCAKTFWEIVSEAGGRVGVVNWWHTWPAEPVNGFIITDRLLYWRDLSERGVAPAHSRLTYPEELLDRVQGLIVHPRQISADDILRFVNLQDEELEEFMSAAFKMNELRGELRFLISSDRSCWQLFDYCLDAFPHLQVAAAYFRAPDVAQHCAFRYTPWARACDATESEREKFGNVVPQAYREADGLLGRLMDRMGPQDTILVLSDHGFHFVDERRGYCHRYGEPPGVIYARGPEIRAGVEIRGASVYDVAPTVLRLCGFPAARQMPGRCLEEILTAQFRRECPPPQQIDTYGPRRPRHDTAMQPDEVTKNIEEHLRALGYLD